MKHFLFIKTGMMHIKVRYNEILYVEATGKYVRITGTNGKVYYATAFLSTVEQLLPEETFSRVHRSYIINWEHVSKFSRDAVFIADKQIPVSRQYREQMKKAVTILHSSGEHKSRDAGTKDLIVRRNRGEK